MIQHNGKISVTSKYYNTVLAEGSGSESGKEEVKVQIGPEI